MSIYTTLLLLFFTSAVAQEHRHPPQHEALHEQFYATWFKPNGGKDREKSCCNQQDCSPAEMRRVAGHWQGRRIGKDSVWIDIPDDLIESNQADPRESPDGASHLCVHFSGYVLCAVLGGGM